MIWPAMGGGHLEHLGSCGAGVTRLMMGLQPMNARLQLSRGAPTLACSLPSRCHPPQAALTLTHVLSLAATHRRLRCWAGAGMGWLCWL